MLPFSFSSHFPASHTQLKSWRASLPIRAVASDNNVKWVGICIFCPTSLILIPPSPFPFPGTESSQASWQITLAIQSLAQQQPNSPYDFSLSFNFLREPSHSWHGISGGNKAEKQRAHYSDFVHSPCAFREGISSGAINKKIKNTVSCALKWGEFYSYSFIS